MKKHEIFPRRDPEFNDYFLRVILYLIGTVVPNPTFPAILPDRIFRLGMTYDGLHPLWALFNQWAGIYPKSQNPDLRTKAITIQKDTIKANIKTELRKLYGDIPKSKMIEDDRETLNLPARKPKALRPAIETQPTAKMKAIGGGRVKITLQVEDDASRPSMQPDADSAEMMYSIGTSPINPESAAKSIVFKKAIHTIQFNIADKGKTVFAYFRWKNESEESKSGPYTEIIQVTIA